MISMQSPLTVGGTGVRRTLREFSAWYQRVPGTIFAEMQDWIRSAKDIPIIYNRAQYLFDWDKRIIDGCDGFLYESGGTWYTRMQGIGLGTSCRKLVWQYAGNYDHWPRVTTHCGIVMIS